LHYTASGIITPIGVMIPEGHQEVKIALHSIRRSKLHYTEAV